jgi:hypothetical protein
MHVLLERDNLLSSRADHSLRVFRGGCDALLKPRPFSPLFDMARVLGGERKAAIEPQSSRRDVFEVFLELLSSKLCIAVFEDMRWADQASIDLLCFISRRVAATKALVILSYLDDAIDRAHALHRMLGDQVRVFTSEPAGMLFCR